jgi:hypothetical protein
MQEPSRLRSRHCVNVAIAAKHALPQWLSIDAAIRLGQDLPEIRYWKWGNAK